VLSSTFSTVRGEDLHSCMSSGCFLTLHTSRASRHAPVPGLCCIRLAGVPGSRGLPWLHDLRRWEQRITAFEVLTRISVYMQDDAAMPAVNLSNRLNPNNIHYDRVLAAQYKRMSKPEKEALWAQDRLMQQRAQQVGLPIL